MIGLPMKKLFTTIAATKISLFPGKFGLEDISPGEEYEYRHTKNLSKCSNGWNEIPTHDSLGNPTIEYRWHVAQQSIKWSFDFDNGFKGSVALPEYFTAWVRDDSERKEGSYLLRASFAIEEVEWCIQHCRGRFTRRYALGRQAIDRRDISASDAFSTPLNVMAFEFEEDAEKFKVYTAVRRNPWAFGKMPLVETEVGYVYNIPWDFGEIDISGIKPQYREAQSNFDRLASLREWCEENCTGRYIISADERSRFLWFADEADAIHFKFTWLLIADEDEED